MVTLAKRFGSAAGRTPSIVTSARLSGTPLSAAYSSMSVTPQDAMEARNASLLVRASVRGWVDESRVRRWPRTWLTARPTVPLDEDRIVSILSLLMVAPSGGSGAPDLRDDARDEEIREEHGRARQTRKLVSGFPSEPHAVHHDEPGAGLAEPLRGARDGGGVLLRVRRERDDDRVEAVGPPARVGLGDVRERGGEDAEAPRPAHPAQHAEQHWLRLDERPRRREAREGARAEERRQRRPTALELGDLRLHARRDVALGDEHG